MLSNLENCIFDKDDCILFYFKLFKIEINVFYGIIWLFLVFSG